MCQNRPKTPESKFLVDSGSKKWVPKKPIFKPKMTQKSTFCPMEPYKIDFLSICCT